jgi:hypothetical protein
MTLTLKLSARVPGKPLKVDGQAQIEIAVLDAKPDKAAFLAAAVEKLREKVILEVANKSREPVAAPSHD